MWKKTKTLLSKAFSGPHLDDSPYDSLNVGFSVANIAVFLFAYGSKVKFVFNCLLEAGKRKSFRVRVL